VLIFCASSVAISAFVMVCLSLLYVRNLWIGAFFAVVVSVSMTAITFFFRRTGNVAIATHLFATIVFVSIISAVATTGAINSPVSVLLLSVPVLIFLVAGWQSGLLWSAITLVGYLSICYLSLRGVSFVQVMREENRSIVIMAMWSLSCILIIGCLSLYDRIVGSLTTALRAERERFRHDALFDPLTGAYNRDSFQKKFDEALHTISYSGGRLALLRFDINNIKAINAQLDYEAGNELIKCVASQCIVALGDSGYLARFGAGEFSVLMPLIKDRGEVISMIAKIQNALAKPVEISLGARLIVKSSMGGVLAPDFSISGRSLMRGAQDALVECGERGEGFVLR